MSFLDRIRSWFDRSASGSSRPADPADLRPGSQPPADAGSSSGLDRPFPDSGPIADPPVGDPPPAGPPERPMG